MVISPVSAAAEADGLAVAPPQAAMNRAAATATLNFFMVLFMVLLSSEKGARDPRAMDPLGPVHALSVNIINGALTL
jgi:hypothetical protein